LKNKPKIGNLTEKQAQNAFAEKFNKTEKLARKSNKKSGWKIQKNKPKMSKFSQKHAQYACSSKFKQQKCRKI